MVANTMTNSNTPTQILIVEDEPKLAQLMIDYLERESYKTHWLENGLDAIQYIKQQTPSLILLDVMLPDLSGFEICSEIRKSLQTPIVMVTARGQEKDRLKGFDLGVDDYICKPFSPRELVSRVKAILKRVGPIEASHNTTTSKLLIDAETYSAILYDTALDLTPLEFRLLAAMAQRPGRVFSRNELLLKAHEDNRLINDRAIDSHIKNLRKKLKDANNGNDPLKSIYGVGYKFEFE